MNNNNNEVIGWGDSFTAEESEFTLISPGNYPFTVKEMERKIYDGNGKIPNGTPYAEVKCEVTGPEGTTTISERLYLLKRMQWKLTQFFQSIGQGVVIGQPFQPNWSTVVGSTGVAEITVREFNGNDGEKKKSNNIKNFLKPGEGKPESSPQQQPQQSYQQQPSQQPQPTSTNEQWGQGGAAF